MAKACVYFFHRRRTRRKTKSPDILKGKLHTILLYLCHGKSDMLASLSRWTRVSFLVIILVFGYIIDSVTACDVDSCMLYTQYSNDQAGYNTQDSNNQCVSLRTYLQCLEGLHGCKGNLKFHSMKKLVRNEMNGKNCSPSGPVYPTADNPVVVGSNYEPELCRFKGRKVYKNCALFGDPHLRTFDNTHQTCKVQGAWPLVNNEHLTVQVTNDRVENSLGATATTKLTVLIKRNTICTSDKYITYQADDKALPTTFDDGKTSYKHSIKLEVVEPDEHVIISLKHIDTKIVVRRVSSYLTFAIQIPEDLLNSSESQNLQLCAQGCPSSEIIDYQEFFKSQQLTGQFIIPREEAEEKCRNAKLSDFYLDSCVFDLMMTGNENFTISVFLALQDALSLDPNYRGHLQNRTTLQIYDSNGSNSIRTCLRGQVSICLVFVLLCFIVKQSVIVRT